MGTASRRQQAYRRIPVRPLPDADADVPDHHYLGDFIFTRGGETANADYLDNLLTHVGLPWQDATVPAAGHREFVRRLADSPAVGIILDDDLLCHTLFYNAPQEMMELARKCRMLVSQSLSIPFAGPPDVGVDTVTHDWPGIARRIADELALGANPTRVEPVIFHGRWRPQVPVNDLGFPHDGVARA